MTSALTLVEILLLCLGAFVLIQRGGGRLPDSLALAIPTALAAISCVFQVAFLLGMPALSYIAEVPLAVAALTLVIRERDALQRLVWGGWGVLRRHPLLLGPPLLAGAYLAAAALVLPPFGNDPLSYHLPRVLLFQQESSLFPADFSKYDLVVKTLGADILSHAFLRHHSDYAVASLQLLAFVSVVAAIYALSRRCAPERSALLATLLVAGMPQLIHQAAVIKSNVFATMAALACLLLGQRLFERPRSADILLLMVALLFGVSARPNFLAFVAAFALCFGLLFWMRSDADAWRTAFAGGLQSFLVAALPLAVLSQSWLFLHNQLNWGSWAGPAGFVEFHRNTEGIAGGIANAVRYFFQSIHLLEPANAAVRMLTGETFSGGLERLYDAWFEPHFGRAGISVSYERFHIDWAPRQEVSWFGPQGFALVLPAIALATWKGGAVLRATSLTLLLYAAAFCGTVAWFPWNGRMLSVVFAGAGPCVAYLLERLSLGRGPFIALSTVGLLLLGWSVLHSHPAGAWSRSHYGAERTYHMYGPAERARLKELQKGFSSGSEVALIVSNRTPIHYILLGNPQARFTLVWPWLRRRMDPNFSLEAYLRREEQPFDLVVCLSDAEPFCRELSP